MKRGRPDLVGPLTLVLALTMVPGMGFAEGLSIALTNDDGWDAAGIQAVKEALRQRGHTVTLVAPLNQQSSSSAAVNSGEFIVQKRAEREYSVAISPDEGAEPVSCVMVAVGIATSLDGRRPDLVVSGINSGANIGSAALHSGTVGAVVGALNPGIAGAVPGIAISTDPPSCGEDCIRDHYREVADYLAGLIERLQAKPGFLQSEPGLLPEGIGLNVNYPPFSREHIKGVRVTRQDRAMGLGGASRVVHRTCPDCAALAVGETATTRRSVTRGPEPDENADVGAFYAGYITIVPIAADSTAPDWARLAEVLANQP